MPTVSGITPKRMADAMGSPVPPDHACLAIHQQPGATEAHEWARDGYGSVVAQEQNPQHHDRQSEEEVEAREQGREDAPRHAHKPSDPSMHRDHPETDVCARTVDPPSPQSVRLGQSEPLPAPEIGIRSTRPGAPRNLGTRHRRPTDMGRRSSGPFSTSR